MHLYKKIKKGIEYFYLRQTKRVDGKVICEFQTYIGNKDRLHEVIQNGLNPISSIKAPDDSQVFHFGSVASFLAILNKLNAFQIIDDVLKTRTQSLPMSYYLLSAAINRCIQARSKNSIASWLHKTSLPSLLSNFDSKKFSSQHFWNHMNSIEDKDIEIIENELAKAVVKKYRLNLDTLLFDSTNFYSYIHSFNDDCTIEKRGKNKQKRMDLRQANFALLVTKDHHIPLYHRVYDGNQNDYTAFQDTILSLKKKRDLLLGNKSTKQFVLVFDNGNVSDDNITLIRKYNLSFVSKLKPSNHQDLLDVPLSKYKFYKNDDGVVKFYKTTKKVYGANYLVVVKYSLNHYKAEYKTLKYQVAEIESQLKKLSLRLNGYIKNNKLPGNVSLNSVANNISDIFKNRRGLKKLFNVEISTKNNKFPIIKWTLEKRTLKKYCRTNFGKTIYFSNLMKMSSEEIIETYSYSHQVEEAFKISKNRNHGCWWPKFHFTDQKIKVHAFYCYISLLLISLLELEAARKRIKIDIHSIIDELHSIYEIVDTFKNHNGKSFTFRRHSSLNKVQKTLYHHFDLDSYFN